MEDEILPPSKRIKTAETENKNTDLAATLQEIWRIVEQTQEDIKPFLGTRYALRPTKDLQNLPDKELAHQLAANTKDLQQQIKEILEILAQDKNLEPVPKCLHTPETVFNATKNELKILLEPISFAFLARTSRSMFQILSPVMCAMPLRVPLGATEIEFKFVKPTTLKDVETCNLPPCVSSIVFSDDFVQQIHNLPSTITQVTFSHYFNQQVNFLPPSLTHLKFGLLFNRHVEFNPNGKITHLTFGLHFNMPVEPLPVSITHLTFGARFSFPLLKPPPALQKLELGRNFRESLDNLPNTVHTLFTFSDSPICQLPPALTRFDLLSNENNLLCDLPLTLQHLQISGSSLLINFSVLPLISLQIRSTETFLPPLNNLPKTLKTLCISGPWNLAPLDNLPAGLEKLEIISQHFTQSLDNLPASLTELEVTCKDSRARIPANLPPSLTNLKADTQHIHISSAPALKKIFLGDKFNSDADHLPPSLTDLDFGEAFNKPVDKLPKNLTTLQFGASFNQPINNLPPNLTRLWFGEQFNHPVENLPHSVTHINFGHHFNQHITHLPPRVTHLIFGANFNHEVNKLPASLTHLTLGFFFNKPVNKLPHGLHRLWLGYSFNQKINHLPPNLKHLTLGYSFDQNVNALPPTLTHLTLGVLFEKPLYHLPNSLIHLRVCVFFHKTINPGNLPPSLKKVSVITMFDYEKKSDRVNYHQFTFVQDPDELYDNEAPYALLMRFNLWKNRFSCESLTAVDFYEECINCPM